MISLVRWWWCWRWWGGSDGYCLSITVISLNECVSAYICLRCHSKISG